MFLPLIFFMKTVYSRMRPAPRASSTLLLGFIGTF